MKSILLTAMLLAASTLFAQNDAMVSPATKAKANSLMNTGVVMPSTPAALNKTSNANLDTLDNLYDKFLTSACLGSSLRMGTTFDTIRLGSGTLVRLTEFGTTFNVPAATGTTQSRRLTQVYALFANGTKVMGSPDVFSMNVRSVNINSSAVITSQTSLGSQNFTIQELSDLQDTEVAAWQPSYRIDGTTSLFGEDEIYNLGNLINIANPMDVVGNTLISFTTVRQVDGGFTDDSLVFVWPVSSINPILSLCRGSSGNDTYVFVRNMNFSANTNATIRPVGWNNLRTFFGYNDSAGVIIMAPVVETYNWPASRDEVLVNSGDLTLFTHYPNPAITHTTLRFDSKESANALVRVMDMSGRLVKQLNNVNVRQGENNILLDVSDLSCGTYTYVIQSGSSAVASRVQVVR